jgi:hypothetical protein
MVCKQLQVGRRFLQPPVVTGAASIPARNVKPDGSINQLGLGFAVAASKKGMGIIPYA